MAFDKRTENTLITAAIEGTYGTSAEGAAVPMRAFGVDLIPQNGDVVNREDAQPYFGARPRIMTNQHQGLDFSVYMHGEGSAVDAAPPYAALLRACGLAGAPNAAVDYGFNPITGSEESATLLGFYDGTKHLLTGARGTLVMSWAKGRFPAIAFKMLGQQNDPTTDAAPAVDWNAWQDPLPVDCQNTPVFSLHGVAAPLYSLEVTQGNNVIAECLPGDNEIRITGRETVGKVEIAASDLATFDPFSIAKAGTTGALQIEQGTTAMNVAGLTASKVQLVNPRYGDQNGRRTITMDLVFLPTTGNDEFRYYTK